MTLRRRVRGLPLPASSWTRLRFCWSDFMDMHSLWTIAAVSCCFYIIFIFIMFAVDVYVDRAYILLSGWEHWERCAHVGVHMCLAKHWQWQSYFRPVIEGSCAWDAETASGCSTRQAWHGLTAAQLERLWLHHGNARVFVGVMVASSNRYDIIFQSLFSRLD